MARDITPRIWTSTNLDNPEVLTTRFPLERNVVGLRLDQVIENGDFISLEEAGAVLIQLHSVWVPDAVLVKLKYLEHRSGGR